MNTKSGTFDEKLRVLETLYAWHDEVADSFGPWACARGCSTCCTSLVTLTTLEAAYLWDRYSEPVRERLRKRKWEFSLPPLGMTVNERASLCGAREDFEDDAPPEDISVCPLLDDGRCMCYEARPLMCRMMLSSISCDTSGHAEMPSRLLSLTTVCQQLAEHFDRDGWSGYMVHMLPILGETDFLEAYRAGVTGAGAKNLRRNRSNPGLLVPPEDRPQIQSWIHGFERRLSGR